MDIYNQKNSRISEAGGQRESKKFCIFFNFIKEGEASEIQIPIFQKYL